MNWTVITGVGAFLCIRLVCHLIMHARLSRTSGERRRARQDGIEWGQSEGKSARFLIHADKLEIYAEQHPYRFFRDPSSRNGAVGDGRTPGRAFAGIHLGASDRTVAASDNCGRVRDCGYHALDCGLAEVPRQRRSHRRGEARSANRGRRMSGPRHKGRPRIEDGANTNEARKPWLKLGMSRRTWYRRQAEKRAGRA
jgi:hypothetical protein